MSKDINDTLPSKLTRGSKTHMTTIKCITCKISKDKKEFYLNRGIPFTRCKPCMNIKSKEYSRTKKGLVATMFNNNKERGKKEAYLTPTYSKQELHDWLYSQPLFHKLYDNWKRLDYQKNV